MPVDTANLFEDVSRRRFLKKSAFWAGAFVTVPVWWQHLIWEVDAAASNSAATQLLQHAPLPVIGCPPGPPALTASDVISPTKR
ncbi:hypothetical protein D3OALGA1CA_4061 [Olavius algarvensis associated proteobacterium Delta 3]|nr:hypothetical protein D3OALGA1CA_4061 [Olavius algarvensis associated proteobacterium Delta 3]